MMSSLLVIPAQAGIQPDYQFGKESSDGLSGLLDSRLRGNDKVGGC